MINLDSLPMDAAPYGIAPESAVVVVDACCCHGIHENLQHLVLVGVGTTCQCTVSIQKVLKSKNCRILFNACTRARGTRCDMPTSRSSNCPLRPYSHTLYLDNTCATSILTPSWHPGTLQNQVTGITWSVIQAEEYWNGRLTPTRPDFSKRPDDAIDVVILVMVMIPIILDPPSMHLGGPLQEDSLLTVAIFTKVRKRGITAIGQGCSRPLVVAINTRCPSTADRDLIAMRRLEMFTDCGLS